MRQVVFRIQLVALVDGIFPLQTTGGVASVETTNGGDLIVSFHTRGAAEQVCIYTVFSFITHPKLMYLQGLAKGTNIPTVGQVQVSWQTAPTPTTTAGGSAAPTASTAGSISADASMLAHDDMDGADDLLTTTGWGVDDDADGMGLM
jgi:RNA-binding protein 26